MAASEATAEFPSSKIALTSQLQQWCDAVLTICVGSWVVDDVVDRVIASYENLPTINLLEREEIRVKVGQYLETLSSAGHRDAEELTFYGLAYLRILYEGPDPRYTGC
jgi:hypothetical protein